MSVIQNTKGRDGQISCQIIYDLTDFAQQCTDLKPKRTARKKYVSNQYPTIPIFVVKEKGKEAYLYSAFYILCISQSAQAWITQFYPCKYTMPA